MWCYCYGMMGFASYLVWQTEVDTELPLALYFSQLLLNWAWIIIFFGQHKVKTAFYEMCLLWVIVAACGVSFYGVNRMAGCLMAPYLTWFSFVTALTYEIWRCNGDEPQIK